jgi:hypothetical protein
LEALKTTKQRLQQRSENSSAPVISAITSWRQRRQRVKHWAMGSATAASIALGLLLLPQDRERESAPHETLETSLSTAEHGAKENHTSIFLEHCHHSIAWLKNAQLPSGAWDVEKWGGRSKFQVGISAMALLALMEVENDWSAQTQRTLNYLLAAQDQEGRFGPTFLGDLYNHCLATRALQVACNRFQLPHQRQLERARSHLKSYRVDQSHYAYAQGLEPEANLSAWANLIVNDQLSYPLDYPKVKEGKSSWAPMDVYLNPEILTQRESFQRWAQELVQKRVLSGELAGSWPIQGPWSHVGGRVFTTSMAIMSLMSKG